MVLRKVYGLNGGFVPSPQVIVTAALREFEGKSEELGKAGGGQDFLLRAIGENVTALHENDAVHFRDQVGEVMRDHDDADAGIGELSQDLAKFVLRE